MPDIFIPIVLTCHKRITTAKVGTDMGGQTFPSVLYFKHKAESKANIKLNTDRKKSTGHTLAEETGKISYNMTNDYMFRADCRKARKS